MTSLKPVVYRNSAVPKTDDKGGTCPLKTPEPQTILDEIIRALADRLAHIQFESLFLVDTFFRAHKQLTEKSHSAHLRKRRGPAGDTFRHMWAAMPAKDVSVLPPISFPIGGKEAKDEQFIEILAENLNSQHLWLFVQAFEALEKYYKDFYGALGYLDPDLWFCDDMGHTRVLDIPTNQLSWFQGQVRKTIAKYNVKKILENLRTVFPQFADIETNEINLAFWFNVGSFFRNLIVHAKAQIPEPELIGKLRKETGHSFSPRSPRFGDLYFSVVSCFQDRGGTCYLELVQTQNITPPSYQGIQARFYELIVNLASHACLSYKLALAHFGKCPFWEREQPDSHQFGYESHDAL